MRNPTDEEIESWLVPILTHGFNRSLGTLQRAGAIDTKELQRQYTGIGSKYYDLATEQIVYTARQSAPFLRQLILERIESPFDPPAEHS